MTFTPVTIAGGGSRSRGENGYWIISKSSTRGLRTINTPMGQELIAELRS